MGEHLTVRIGDVVKLFDSLPNHPQRGERYRVTDYAPIIECYKFEQIGGQHICHLDQVLIDKYAKKLM